jgi:flagellar hook-associated protein 2
VSSILPTINFGGLASGLDTNTIVDQLMSLERRPKIRLIQKQQVEEARQNALKDVKTRLSNLQSAAVALKDALVQTETQTVESTDSTKIGVTKTGTAAPGGYTITVSQLARAHQVTQASAISSASAADTLHIKVGAGATVDVAIASGDSLDTIASKINGSSGIGVYASVVNSKLVLSGKDTGAANTITVTSDGSLAGDLSLAQSLVAQDASYRLNGGAATLSASNTLTAAIPGVTITLKGVVTVAETINVSVPAVSTATASSKVKEFVDQYNSTLDFIRGKLTEAKVKDPKTADDRAKGVLRGDVSLAGLLGQLRGAMSDPFSGRPASLDTLSEIGITTGTASSTISKDAVAGKLTLDSAVLDEKFAASFTDVTALLSNVTGSATTEGLAQRVERLVNPWTSSTGILTGRIDSQQSMIDSLVDRQAEMDTRLALREKSLRAQFTAMETALQRAQAQGSWLSGQLAALA